MQKIVVTYTEELMPLAIEMINHLVETFAKVGESLHTILQSGFTLTVGASVLNDLIADLGEW